MVRLGIDNFLADRTALVQGRRVGLLCNQASVNGSLQHSRVALQNCLGADLTCLFSPQHGFHAEKQDNMIESDHSIDHVTSLPLFSLYGETRRPTQEMFEHMDILLIDLVDVGTRVYTFMYSMAYCLGAAAAYGKKVIVLDRPNPIGGNRIEGNILKTDYCSFVGLYPIPMRHGLTFGELARYFNQEFDLNADLDVVSMSGWRRDMYFRDTGLPWVYPSPNMPTPETAMVYPGQVIWEGTDVSEGRGTTLPFELVGAPYWQHEPITKKLAQMDLPGCVFRPVVFEPTSGKCAGTSCNGFQIHVTDPDIFMPYRSSLVLLQIIMGLYPEQFSYKDPPYEYEYEKLPMDLILGDREVRKKLEKGLVVSELEGEWQEELSEFESVRQNYFLY